MSTSEKSGLARIVLEVSNQSFVRDRVDIEVRLGRHVLVTGQFDVGDGVEAGHRWSTYTRDVEPGEYALHAKSAQGGAELEVRIELKSGSSYATLMYWYSERHPERGGYFTFSQSDRPRGRM